MSKVTFTAFADLHHHPAWYKTEAPERLAAIQERAKASHSDFIINLGDLCHKPTESADLIRQFRDFSIPGYFVLGNHEFDIDSFEQVLAAYGMSAGYYYFDHGGYRFVILDENYFSDFPGIYFHYSSRNYFDHGRTRDWMPPEEIAWLRDTVLTSPFPCLLFSHATLECPLHTGGVKCKDEVRKIIADSQKTPGRVIMCVNGHNHRSGLDYVDGIARLDVNSASFNWVSKPHHFYPEEWYHIYECVGNQIIFKDPVSAVITLDIENGTIEVEGCPGSFVNGITTEMTDNPSGYRICTPDMVSATIRI